MYNRDMDLERHQKLLMQRIDEVMHYVWDPIGVSDTPEARNEYSSYVGGILRAVLDGCTKEDIARQLTTIATENMGLRPNKKHDYEVAELILDWARFLKEGQ